MVMGWRNHSLVQINCNFVLTGSELTSLHCILLYFIFLFFYIFLFMYYTQQTYLYSHYHWIVFFMLTGADITFIETLQ